jgi:predicted transcriptional regulator
MSDVLNRKIGFRHSVVMKAARDNDWAAEIQTDVVVRILEAAKNKQDHHSDAMRSGVEMPDPQITDYLSRMARAELLKYNDRAGTYHTTRKGQAFLKTYHRLGEFIRLIDEEIGL